MIAQGIVGNYGAAVASLVATIIGSFIPNSKAYTLEGPSWPKGSAVFFQLNLGNPGAALQDGNTSWGAAIAPAFEMWNQYLQSIQTTGVMDLSVIATFGDHLNSVVFSSTIFGEPFGKNTLAVTCYSTVGPTFSDADTFFNTAQKFDSYRGPLQYANGVLIADIRRVFLHELGHAIGLGHPDTAGQIIDAIMNSGISSRSTLAQDDINGGQFLYGASSFAPTPTPSPTATAIPTPTPVSRLANIATRINVGLGPNVMIGGFIIGGSAPKQVLVRALGPSLGSIGVNGALPNPFLELHDPSGATIAVNDDWQTGGQRDQIIATAMPPLNDRESAIVATVSPGNHTALVRGVNETTGIATVEVYELDSTTTRLFNISARGHVGVDGNVMIGGFIIQGNTQKKVIVRALGPSLHNSLVQGELVDPTLELYNGDGVLLAANDDWVDSPQFVDIVASTLSPPDRRESAIIASLPPGSFSAIMRGANSIQGIGLIEVYDLDR